MRQTDNTTLIVVQPLRRIAIRKFVSTQPFLRAAVEQRIIPRLNEKAMPDIPEEVRSKLKFIFVDNVDEMLPA